MKYTVKRDVPDILELITAVRVARFNLELCVRELNDEITTDKDVLDNKAFMRLQTASESIYAVVASLERAEEIAEALDSIACREKHLAAVKRAIFTPQDKRTGADNYTLHTNCVDERPDDTPQQTYDRYRAAEEEKPLPDIELW